MQKYGLSNAIKIESINKCDDCLTDAFELVSMPITFYFKKSKRIALSLELDKLTQHFCPETMPDQLAHKAANSLERIFSQEGGSIIRLFKKKQNTPFLLVKGLVNTDMLPPTPTDDIVPDKKGWRIQAAALLGMLKLCEFEPASLLDEMGGRLFHMVMPASNSQKSFHRSTKPLNLHTEVVNGYFIEEGPEKGAPISPDVFGLICLRNPDRIQTKILPIPELLYRFSSSDLEELMKNNFTVRSQSSFDREIVLSDVPVFRKLSKGQLGMRYSHSKLSPQNASAKKALLSLKRIIQEIEPIGIALTPGDVLIINNRSCLHGRSLVNTTHRFDGTNRWLLRVYGYKMASIKKMIFSTERPYAMILNQ